MAKGQSQRRFVAHDAHHELHGAAAADDADAAATAAQPRAQLRRCFRPAASVSASTLLARLQRAILVDQGQEQLAVERAEELGRADPAAQHRLLAQPVEHRRHGGADRPRGDGEHVARHGHEHAGVPVDVAQPIAAGGAGQPPLGGAARVVHAHPDAQAVVAGLRRVHLHLDAVGQQPRLPEAARLGRGSLRQQLVVALGLVMHEGELVVVPLAAAVRGRHPSRPFPLPPPPHTRARCVGSVGG